MGMGESEDIVCSVAGDLVMSGVEKIRVCVSPGASSAFTTTCW
jgi:hypothetical protein